MKKHALIASLAIISFMSAPAAWSQNASDQTPPPATVSPALAPVPPVAEPAASAPSAPEGTANIAAPATSATPDTATNPAPTETGAASQGSIANPPAGKGQIVFFRPSRFAGAALSFSVHEGLTGVGKLGNGSYFVLVTDPGPHEFSIQSEAKDTLRLEIEPDETVYVQQTIGMGIVMARPHLTPSDQATFAKSKLKLSVKTATDLKPSAASKN